MKTTLLTIMELNDAGHLRHYAVWLKLKNIYKNGCYYKYNNNKLHNQTGLSNTALRKYIQFFLDNKWCHLRDGNLCFVAEKTLRVDILDIRNRKFVKIDQYTKVSDILTQLRFLIIKNKNAQFEFVRQKSRDATILKGNNMLKRMKKARAFFRKYDGNMVIESRGEILNYKVSYEKIGVHLGLGKTSGFNLIKRLQMEGKITKISHMRQKVIKNVGSGGNFLPDGMFFYNGAGYKQKCNEYLFN